MKILLKLEALSLTLLSVYLFLPLGYAWWWYPLLFLTPDLGMLGYLINPRLGAWTYNLVHHQAVAIVLYLLGLALSSPLWQAVGLIMLGHSSFDRVFGYGLKYFDSFKHTHMGQIGPEAG